MLDFFSDLTVDGERHAVVVVLQVLARALLVVAQRHDSDQAERLLRFGLLHGHGRVLSAARGEPGAVDDGGRRIHRRVVRRLEHDGGGGGHAEKTERRCYQRATILSKISVFPKAFMLLLLLFT